MSTGIIITDKVPSSCSNCGFLVEVHSQDKYCSLTSDDVTYEPMLPDSCPIHPLPEEDTSYDSDDEYYTGYVHGWNRCLKKIKEGNPISC